MAATRYKLNNWAIINYGHMRTALMGKTEGHPEWDDGHSIVTSSLLGRSGNLVVTSSGSYITLGEPREDYEAEFPGAKQRLMDSLSIILLEVV